MTISTRLVDVSWWRAAALRALYTAITVALPYLGGSLISEVPWLTILSAGALAAVASLLTSIAGLPEAEGSDLPWWLAMLERTVKTFAQALAAGFVGATLLTDVEWLVVLQFAALSTLGTLLRLILATLPADPTVKHAAVAGTAAHVLASDQEVRAAAVAAVRTEIESRPDQREGRGA